MSLMVMVECEDVTAKVISSIFPFSICMDDFVYRPSPDQIRNTNIMKLALKNGIESLEELYRRADEDPEWFWPAVIEDCNLEFFSGYDKVRDQGEGIPHTRWFTGGSVNITYNCVERYSGSEKTAIRYEAEDGKQNTTSYAELDRITGKLAGALVELGISRGDRVGIYMPLNPECVYAFYAIMRIGAVAVPMFSGYGAEAVRNRAENSGIKALFITASYTRKGKNVDMVEIAREVEGIHLIIHGSTHLGKNESDFYSLVESGKYTRSVRTGTEEPAIMLYTSGTTGKPKGTVHVHGGTLVNTVKEVKYYLDMRAEDTLYWITDLGWMMGPWSIMGANALGGTVFVYDGAVNYPGMDRAWDLVERNGVTILGLSPTFVRLAKYNGIDRAMEGVRLFASTGEPWDEESWLWLFHKIGKSQVPIANISGGTDIIGCFLASTAAIPLKPKCLYKGLGMNVSVFDEKGETLFDSVGYLVSRNHCPSMTRGIWGQKEKYLETYWGKYRDAWFQGDWAEMDRSGYFFLYGRADEVIKIAGKRVGPNEIEDSATKVDEVTECAAAGIPDQLKGETVVVFYTGSAGKSVEINIRKQIENDLGKSFSPKFVVHLETLPKTKNGKILRRVMRNVFLDSDPGDTSTIEDGEVLERIRAIGRELYAGGVK